MNEEKSFYLSVCRLLQAYPLYDHRAPDGEEYCLRVLLIGNGEKLDALRNKILSHGQLLDTRLEVTVVTKEKKAALERLAKDAHDLKRFIRIEGCENTVEMDCGVLLYKEADVSEANIREILDEHAGGRKYVLISLETDADAPKAIEPASGQVIAWVAGDTIRICGTDERFLPDRKGSDMEDLEQVAYRLHYAYEKGNDPYITNREIRTNFHVMYNYRSNIESALHIQSKIKCAGIDPTGLSSAAEKFGEKMTEDIQNGGDLLDRLAQLEHRRWCVSKATDGRRVPEKLDVIYGDDGSTTHSKGEKPVKWHAALVPYILDKSYRTRLSEEDWLVAAPDTITDLDELDKQTLRIHRYCAEISRERMELSREDITKLKNALPDGLKNHAERMKEALDKMLYGSRDDVFLYRYHLRKLEEDIQKIKDDESKKCDLTPVKKILSVLNQHMGAPIEYLTRKDYKKQNLIQIGSIPFALCGWKSAVLVKLMAESVQECVAAAWQLEPEKIAFVDTAETLEDLKHLHRKAQQIEWFLSRNCDRVISSYHIFVPRSAVYLRGRDDKNEPMEVRLHELLIHEPGFFGSGDWKLYETDSLEPETLRPRFTELMYECNASSIDMTGGKPSLISLANNYARYSRTSAFFIQNNRIYNCSGARSMELQALDKGIGVQQLFDQVGAQRIKQDDENISDAFYEQCGDLWKIAREHAKDWYRFCLCFAKAYRCKEESTDPDEYLCVPGAAFTQTVNNGFKEYESEFDDILKQLRDGGLLTWDPVRGVYRVPGEEVLACLRNSGKILEYYIYCTARKLSEFDEVVMSWMFRHADDSGAAKNELDVICTSQNGNLFISAKNVALSSLERNNFLNYVCYEVGWLADRFGGSSHKSILAAPNVPQFEADKRSRLVQHAMKRGVYLLGDKCFEDENLIQVLKNIDQGKEDWCEFLLPACVS